MTDIQAHEYNALRAEERDRMNGRAQVWTLYLSIVGAFVFAAIQGGVGIYAAALCPLLLACLARHTRHSEDVLHQVRKYLYQVEQQSEHQGYEHFTREQPRPTHGGYRVALRDAFLLTDVLAVVSVLVRLYADHLPLWVAALVLVSAASAMIQTWRWLAGRRKSMRGGKR